MAELLHKNISKKTIAGQGRKPDSGHASESTGFVSNSEEALAQAQQTSSLQNSQQQPYSSVHVNDVCKDCLKWESYQDKCWVHWKGKKVCSLKVKSTDEWQDEHRFRQF